MDQLKQYIEEEGYPEDYDLNEIALLYCQHISEENEEIQTQTNILVAKMKAGQANKLTLYKPVDIRKDIEDLGSTIFLPKPTLPKEIILKKGWFKNFLKKLGEALQQLAIDIIVGVIKGLVGMN